jgi:hypothetical protein
LLRWYADFLLDRRHHHVFTPERNLVFSVLNLVETMLIGAIWLRAAGEFPSAGEAGYASFALVTQLGLPSVEGAWAQTAVIVTEVLALTILLGGFALVIAEVQTKVKATGRWRGERYPD